MLSACWSSFIEIIAYWLFALDKLFFCLDRVGKRSIAADSEYQGIDRVMITLFRMAAVELDDQ